YLFQGRTSDAEQALGPAISRAPESPLSFLIPYHLAFLKRDVSGMERLLTQAKGRSALEDLLAHLQGLVLAGEGRLQAARQSARHAIELATADGRLEREAVWETGAALWEALYGNFAAATRGATHVLDIAKGRHVRYGAALALAIAGDGSRAQMIADD